MRRNRSDVVIFPSEERESKSCCEHRLHLSTTVYVRCVLAMLRFCWAVNPWAGGAAFSASHSSSGTPTTTFCRPRGPSPAYVPSAAPPSGTCQSSTSLFTRDLLVRDRSQPSNIERSNFFCSCPFFLKKKRRNTTLSGSLTSHRHSNKILCLHHPNGLCFDFKPHISTWWSSALLNLSLIGRVQTNSGNWIFFFFIPKKFNTKHFFLFF